MSRRSGRRPGKPDTREAILAAARHEFAEKGYEKATVRAIAERAGVDPALIHHYFGNKEKLFFDVVQFPYNPDTLMAKVFEGGNEGLAERLVRTFLTVWEAPTTGAAMAGILRSAASHRLAGRLVRELFTTQIVRRVAAKLGEQVAPDEIPIRASLVASQLFGLGLTRYILKIQPLVDMDVEAVVAFVAPTIDRYLFGDLGATSGRTPST